MVTLTTTDGYMYYIYSIGEKTGDVKTAVYKFNYEYNYFELINIK